LKRKEERPDGRAKVIGGVKMVDLQAAVAIAIAVLVALFVPGLVWATVIAGLYQLIRERIQERQAAGEERATGTLETLAPKH